MSVDERPARLRTKLAEVDERIAQMQAARDELAQIVDAPHKAHVDARLRALGLSLTNSDR